jgi:hypothetical protein
VEGQRRRETEPRSPLTAAWGHPPIVLRCGVGVPAAYEPTALVDEVDGVAWFREDTDGGARFTSVGRVANVEAFVPEEYAPEVNALVDLAAPVLAQVPEVQP